MTLRTRSPAAAGSALALAATLLATPLTAQDTDRLWGEVLTASGNVYEGYIRWDRNEGGWWDLLDGSKALDVELLEWMGEIEPEGDRDRSIEFLGVRISWDDDDFPSTAESGILFGHVRTLRVIGDDAALLTLRSGEEVELEGGSTDLGDGIRELSVEDPERGTIELRWRDLDRIDFRAAPSGAARASSPRLWGTAMDRWGNEYTGFVSWDLDEILESDVLDGDEDGRDREIPFAQIEGIERLGYSGSRVWLRNGDELELEDSNDVDDGNRGIQITDPGLGQVDIPWSVFESIRFETMPSDLGPDAFDGGHRLYGTVETEDGEVFTGTIIWDGDEEWSWEMLDGDWRDVAFNIEFGRIAAIVKRSSRSAEVTLLDGRTYELEESNDVDRDNKGIVVELDDGEAVVIDWDRFSEVSFRNR